MKRRIIHVNRDLCNGCGACAAACHEGAIEMKDGKAFLAREDYCDGLGDCLPACPVGAISFEAREAPVCNAPAIHTEKASPVCSSAGCPGSTPRAIRREPARSPTQSRRGAAPSRLAQWPCQIKLVPANAPYFENANLLIAADCTAYAYADFHEDFMRGHITLIGCPKLDEGDYAERLTAILRNNDLRSIKILRMEVPCCGGLEAAVKRALQASGKMITPQVVTVTTDGKILE